MATLWRAWQVVARRRGRPFADGLTVPSSAAAEARVARAKAEAVKTWSYYLSILRICPCKRWVSALMKIHKMQQFAKYTPSRNPPHLPVQKDL